MNLKCFGGKVVLRGLSLLCVLALLACFVIFSSSTASAAPPSVGFARIIHAAPSAGNVDVFVDGMQLPASIAFGTLTAYAPVPAGAHHIQIAPAGKGAGAAMIDDTVTIAPQTAYTLAALGTTATGFSLNTFVDNNQLVGGRNMAKMRVYHLSPDAGPINLTTGGRTVIAGLAYPDASDYLTMPAGTATFSAAATQSGTRVAVPATLQPGMVTSIFAIGLLNGTPALQFVTATVPAVPARALQAEPVGHA